MYKKAVLIILGVFLAFCSIATCIGSLALLYSQGKFDNLLQDEEQNENSEFTEIYYRFVDASVEPRYHRSYTITVTSNNINVKVDSYGKVLKENNYEISKEEFVQISGLIEKYNIKKGNLGDSEGCTGGTTEIIKYKKTDGTNFSASVYHCQGDWGTLEGNTEAFAIELKTYTDDIGLLLNLND